ncbi:MAG: phosphoribosylpyrophosphate synthetase [Bdellovibrionaceae bacterium]|nr:phosphoribosylpyrophosphate synthetase [Pseudobdellovibrionaceae bacterium]
MQITNKPDTAVQEEHKAGTGFMLSLSEAIKNFQEYGCYTKNLSAKEDHFECNSGQYKLYPANFEVDKMIRFENSSDPDDNSILYAITDPTQNIKGLYVEGYGAGQPSLSREMIDKLKTHAEELSHESSDAH